MTKINRRQFLKRSTQTALSMGALTSGGLLNLAAAAGTKAGGDYRALVNINLNGGNDAFNTVVPTSLNQYTPYADARLNLALDMNSLLPINPSTNTGVDWGFHPSCVEMQNLFETNRMAIVANIGSLITPLTRQEYLDELLPIPPRLFSHSDQQDQWATSRPDIPSITGWGGRMADELQVLNMNQQIPMTISLAGTNKFQTGDTVSQFTLAPSGPAVLQLFGTGLAGTADAYLQLQNLPHQHLMERRFSDTHLLGLMINQQLIDALNITPDITTIFPNGSLGNQLRMVARTINIRNQIDVQRQIFQVEIGGWDTHAEQLTNHAALLTNLSQSLQAFYDALTEMGVGSQVTTVVSSEFGRSLTVNGDGTDHGWGGHAFVMGDNVIGREIYGAMPVLEIDGPNDTSGGRFIPTTSVDQLGATLGSWLGLNEMQLNDVFTNLTNFDSPNLNFMKA